MLKQQQFILFFWEVAKQLGERSQEWDVQGSLFNIIPTGHRVCRCALFCGERPGALQSEEKGARTAGTVDQFAHIEGQTQNQCLLGQ